MGAIDAAGVTAPNEVDSVDTGGNVDIGGVGDAAGAGDAVDPLDPGVDATAPVAAAGVVPKAVGDAVPVLFVDASAWKDGAAGAPAVAGAVPVAVCAAPVDMAGVPIADASGARFDGAAEDVTGARDVAVNALPGCTDVAAAAVDGADA